jgi:hypothetical protein
MKFTTATETSSRADLAASPWRSVWLLALASARQGAEARHPRRSLPAMGARCLAALMLFLTLGFWSVMTPAAANAGTGWTVSFTVQEQNIFGDWENVTKVPLGTTVYLTATSNKDVNGTPYYIVVETTGGAQVVTCGTGTSCGTTIQLNSAYTQTYKAYVGYLNGTHVQATSSSIPVTWQAWSVKLTASSGTSVGTGTTVALTATADMPIELDNNYELFLIIRDSGGNVLAECITGTTCAAGVESNTAANHSYNAIATQSSDGSCCTLATSSLAVTWGSWSVGLTASLADGTVVNGYSVTVGSVVTLTAQSNDSVSGSPYDLAFLDDSDNVIYWCNAGNTCVTTVTIGSGTHVYKGVLAKLALVDGSYIVNGVPLELDAVGVTGMPAFTVKLKASATHATAGTLVTLTATANQDVGPSVYDIMILDSKGMPACKLGSGTTCSTSVGLFGVAGSYTYRAVIGDDYLVSPQAISAPVTVVINPGAATHLQVSVATNPTEAGAAHSVTVKAFDGYGNVATGYTGTIHFTSSDTKAVLPADYTFTTADKGVHKFTTALTLKTAGSRSVTATDKTTSSITGSQTVTVTPGVAKTLKVSIAASPYPVGTAHSVTVTAIDAYGNTATGYVGTIHFTSSDGSAVLPGNYTFTGADNGKHKFTNGLTLNTTGSQSVTATDTGHSSITGSQTVTVE